MIEEPIIEGIVNMGKIFNENNRREQKTENKDIDKGKKSLII